MNDPLNLSDPTGLRADDCSMAANVCVIDDLGGPFGTSDDGRGGRTVKAGAGRLKNDMDTLGGSISCGIIGQPGCEIASRYKVNEYTDEIYFAAIHAEIDTRLVYGVIARETAGWESPLKDHAALNGLDNNPNIGPGNIGQASFISMVSRHEDIFGGANWSDVITNKVLAAKITAFRLRDLNDDLNGSISRNGVTRISLPHGCERRGENAGPAVFCRSTLLSYAYIKKYKDTVGGAVFDRIFRERKFPAIDNAEFIPADGSVTNAVTPYLGQGWDYYCTGGFVC